MLFVSIFLQTTLISVFSITVSKSQYALLLPFIISLVLHICPFSHHLHRWIILSVFGVSSYQVSEKVMAPHSSTLAWKIPWTEEPGRLQSMGSRRVGHDWATSLSLFTFMRWRRKWQPTPVFLPGESRDSEPGGLPSMGSHGVGHDFGELAAASSIPSLIHCPSPNLDTFLTQ